MIYTGIRSVDQLEITKLWLDNGFSLHKTSRQVAMNPLPVRDQLNEGLKQSQARLHTAGFELTTVNPEQLEAVQALWDQALDPYDFTYQSKPELCAEIEHGHLLGVSNAAGRLYAVMQVSSERGSSTTWHLAVSEPCRRKFGMGTALLVKWLAQSADAGIARCLAWVDEANLPSLNLFSKLGFQATGRMSDQLLYIPKR